MAGLSSRPIVASSPQLLEAAFSGDHAWCLEKMRPAGTLPGAVPLAPFLSGGGLDAALDRLATAHAGTDRRAIASYWSLYYVSSLCIPQIVAARAGLFPALWPEMLTFRIDGNGLPDAFGLCLPVAEGPPPADPLQLLMPLLKDHLLPVSLLLKTRTGMAPKLFFNNAAVYIDYALTLTQPAGTAGEWPGRAVFEAPGLADGSRNPLHGLLRQETIHNKTHCRRKICCLRHQLPGIPGCGELCALPELRQA